MAKKFETDNWPYVPANKQVKWATKRPVRVIVIHSTESSEIPKGAENNANWFQNPSAGGSAHIVVDNNSIVQCVLDNNQAAGARGVNRDGIHIELVGKADQSKEEWTDAYSILLLERAANATAQYCLKYTIPVIHLTNQQLKAGDKGIIGHYQASEVYPPNNGHFDPGKGFPWDFFMERVVTQVKYYAGLEEFPNV